ncbi:hypothetical protein BGX28_006172 [Mortierella sp. GBA30]|nr:hypothetical protein BGX28_006172 [Mortierella sp. GBA30]
MCMYSSKDGFSTNFHLVHIGSFAINGAGLTIQEAAAIQANGRITPRCAGIWGDAHVYKLKEITDFIHVQGSKIGIQLNRAGRKNILIANSKASIKAPYTGHRDADFWRENGVGPSGDLHWNASHEVPRELSIDEIQEIVDVFGAAASLLHVPLVPGRTLWRSMLPMVTLRPLHQFLSPITNQISASDMVEQVVNGPSWEIEQTVKVAQWAHDAGVNVLHVSGGGNISQQQIKAVPEYQVHLADRVKKAVPGHSVITVGIFIDGKQAEDILHDEKADLVAAARNPNISLNAARELNVKAVISQQYSRGRTTTD